MHNYHERIVVCDLSSGIFIFQLLFSCLFLELSEYNLKINQMGILVFLWDVNMRIWLPLKVIRRSCLQSTQVVFAVLNCWNSFLYTGGFKSLLLPPSSSGHYRMSFSTK